MFADQRIARSSAAAAENDWGLDDRHRGTLRPLAQATLLCGLLALIVLADGERVVTWLPVVGLSLRR
jgi:hypothetical protein